MIASCASPPRSVDRSAEAPADLVIDNARLVGSEHLVTIRVANGVIVAVDQASTANVGTRTIDLGGATVLPQIVDSHVHLAYHPVGTELRQAGVAATLDLGAPLEAIRAGDRRALGSGPMITPPHGYPTQSWGGDGYGLEASSVDDAKQAVDALASAGASVIKVPLPDAGGLGGAVLEAVVEQAHARKLRVVGHALSAADVRAAAEAGVDVLAHAPLEPLDGETVRAWAPRPVISTLAAFNARRAADNLEALRDAGSPVVYGTDLGNTREVGISASEITALLEANMSAREILDSMIRTPIALWNLPLATEVAVGQPTCLLAVRGDPLTNPLALTEPVWTSCPGQVPGT